MTSTNLAHLVFGQGTCAVRLADHADAHCGSMVSFSRMQVAPARTIARQGVMIISVERRCPRGESPWSPAGHGWYSSDQCRMPASCAHAGAQAARFGGLQSGAGPSDPRRAPATGTAPSAAAQGSAWLRP